MMKAKNLRALTVEELYAQKLDLLKNKKIKLLLEKKTRTLTKTHQLRDVRRQTARINTILSEKQKIQ